MGYRAEYLQALILVAKAADAVCAQGALRPVIVGGAAVEFYTAGGVISGDIDIVTARDDLFELALQDQGFIKPAQGIKRGWVHPDLLMGVEIVSDSLLRGEADRGRCLLFDADGHLVSFVSVEDMIADRMGQHSADPRRDDMQGQAVALFLLANDLDRDYLERRIRTETSGDFGVEDLEQWAAS